MLVNPRTVYTETDRHLSITPSHRTNGPHTHQEHGRVRKAQAHALPMRMPVAKTSRPPTTTCTADETSGISM
jgi:hypothetical protein